MRLQGLKWMCIFCKRDNHLFSSNKSVIAMKIECVKQSSYNKKRKIIGREDKIIGRSDF